MNTTNVGVITDQKEVDINSKTLEECLQTSITFSGTSYYNICNNTQTFVPFGFWNFAIIFFLVAITLFLTTAGIYSATRD